LPLIAHCDSGCGASTQARHARQFGAVRRDSLAYELCWALNASVTAIDAVVGLHRLAVVKLPLSMPSVPKRPRHVVAIPLTIWWSGGPANVPAASMNSYAGFVVTPPPPP
jgi:hypothetical protein